MTPTGVTANAYNHSPEQHPNFILGNFQILFWLLFRPTVWRNHLSRIFHTLDIDSNRTNRLLSELYIQRLLVVPLLVNITLGLVLWKLGNSADNIPVSVAWAVAWTVWWRVGFILIELGKKRSLTLLLEWILAWGVPVLVMAPYLLLGGVSMALIRLVAFVFFGRFTWSWFFGVTFSALILLLLTVISRIILGVPVLFVPQSLLFLGVGVTIDLWRPVLLYPFVTLWNILLYLLDKQRKDNKTILRWHSAFWDELQVIPLYGLDKHLLLVLKRNPVEGKAAINYLTTSYQHWAAETAQIELDARSLQGCADVEAIREAHCSLVTGELNSEISPLLRIFSRISEDVDAALNQASTYNQRLLLRDVADKLNLQLQNFARSSDKYTVRFYPIIKSWREIVINYIDELTKINELRQEIDSPYITGNPLTLEQEIFTGRDDIGLRIEQLLLDRRRPPLLLYGQRRMGKTSLLNNIGKLLPSNIIPMFVDLQGAPSSANDHAGFLYNLARDMEKSAKKQGVILPSLAREVLKSDPFTYFYEWLDKVEQALEQNTALLALDEFEVLDNAIAKGRFDGQDVLGMLRHLIQHRPRFKVLLAGSHTIEEYQRWASYLINVQVVHISYLKEAEARQLIECPVKDFTLRYEPNAVERVLQFTRCHPFLVQLLCAEIIVLKNEQDPSIRRLATLADVEAAIPEALQSGGFFFADIQNNQVDATGQAILRFIAAQGEGTIVSRQTLLQQFADADITFKLLLQRELIEEVDDGYRFQVELIRRWFI
ncbi:MAG: AAA family ATPase [Nostoc sp.]|uniref:AAA family ATPase n=1 Tax=Nostoc sp. TaxID=1180 RepID=UPI002FF6B9B3